MKFLGFMSYSKEVVQADLDGKSPYGASPGALKERRRRSRRRSTA